MGTKARSRRSYVAATICTVACALVVSSGATAAPGGYSQAQIDHAIITGVDWLASQQQADGRWDTGGFPEAETGLAIVSYGVLDLGKTANLDAAHRAQLEKAVDWLLSRQNANGSWASGLSNYSTGIALLALSYVRDLQSPTRDIDGAIAKGRAWAISVQNAPPSVTGNPGSPDCSTTYGAPNHQYWCGGWGYSGENDWSDASNTGFALTGLAATGGVPAAAGQFNVGWQRNVQMLSSNHYAQGTRSGGDANDGGGSYYPFSTNGDFSSNANDTGSLLFGYAYDGVPATDPGAQAAIVFGNDILDVYEIMKDVSGAPRRMVYHFGNQREPACEIGTTGCNWGAASQSEGGYHYSLFALSKGLGQYGPAVLSDPSNFYAKVVDLLLSQQADEGSWPADGRDDGSTIGATAFSIMSLGRVGQPANAGGTVFNDVNGNGVRDAGDAGLAGWTVYADTNGNGSLDANEVRTVSRSDGTYTLQNLPEGTGTIRQIPQAGYVCTKPSGCAYAGVKFDLGANITGLDFGDRAGAVAGESARSCGSRRTFVIHLRIPKAVRKQVAAVTVKVNGKRVRVSRSRGRHVAHVNLRGLAPGRYSVQITVRLKSGKVMKGKRRYFTCHAPRQSGPPRL
jgi:hypothetical protein